MKEENKDLQKSIVEHSYIDIMKLGPEIAKYISLNLGSEVVFQPDAVMHAIHSIPYSDHDWDESIAINYFLLVKKSERKDSYKRGYNKDLSDIEENQDGLILYRSHRIEPRYGEKTYFSYPNDANGRSVFRGFKRLPFYCLNKKGELERVYGNFGNMYDVIDMIIQNRIQLEMTEIESSVDTAIKQYAKKKSE